MKKPILLSCFCLLSILSFAQFSISGKVVDAESKEKLQGASVFAQNTTKGTTTDSAGAFYLYLDKGGYELIVSFTGYESQTIVVEGEKKEFIIELKKADNSMSEVVIKSSFEVEDGWEKYGSFFLQRFIGSTPFADSCFLENPEALKFLYYKRNDRLKILASEPLRITNYSLGYELRYELDSFVHFFKTDMYSYRGQCLYTQIDTTYEQLEVWKANRAEAYAGSKLHFLRSYYDSTLKQEGFTVDEVTSPGSTKFARLRNPYDSIYYFFDDTTANAFLYFPVTASITYERKAPEQSYLKQYKLPLNVKMQISYINLAEEILIKPNGYFFPQSSWVSQGYWSWKNLADQLPYDYERDR